MANAIGPELIQLEMMPAALVPSSRPLPESGFLGITAPIMAGQDVAYVAPTIVAAADELGAIGTSFVVDYYYRIWVIPGTLTANNPQYGVAIPFNIWNAFPNLTVNTVTGITETGATGLDLSFGPGTTWKPIEYKEVGITITPDADPSVDATFLFSFTAGSGTLRFLASISNILPLPVEEGMTVTYSWLTDVLSNYDGSENRIALRARPRRAIVANVVIQNDAQRKLLYDTVYKSVAGLLLLPAYQTQARLGAATVISDNTIVCDAKRADLRQGEFAVIIKLDGTAVLYKLSAVTDTSVTVETAHTEVIPATGAIVLPVMTCRLQDNSGVLMNAIRGGAEFKLTEFDARTQLVRPGSAATLTTLGGVPVLERRPLGDDAPELLSAGLTIIDNDTGKPAQYTAWDQKYMSGGRSYLINTLFSTTDMNYWLTFLDHCRGRQRSFLASTFREDLVRAPGGLFTTGTLEVVGLEYASLYVLSPTYKQIELVTSVGTFLLEVASAAQLGNNTVLTFVGGIPVSVAGATVSRISYLMRVRLMSDQVVITYNNTHAIISLGLQAVKA
jgi:hypothetical protein